MESVKIIGVPFQCAFTSAGGRRQDAPRNGAKHVCRDLRRADHRAVRGARPDPEGGRTAVNYANIVGLVLCLLTALFLVAALLFPERF